MSRVKVIIDLDDDMTFGELEQVRKVVATFMVINSINIHSDGGTIVMTGILIQSSAIPDQGTDAHGTQ